MTVNTRVIKILLQSIDLPYFEIEPGLQLQVLPDILDLPRCQKHHFAAFIADRGILVVWEDDPQKILDRASLLENKLVKMIWKDESPYNAEEKRDLQPEIAVSECDDVESQIEEGPRKTVLYQAILTSVTIFLAIAAISGGWRKIAIEIAVDQNWKRVFFVFGILPQIWLALVRSLDLAQRNPVNLHSSSSRQSSEILPR